MLESLLVKGGRRFAIAILGMYLATAVTLVSLLVMSVRPMIADSTASVMWTFGVVLSVAIGAYTGSNAMTEKLAGAMPKTTTKESTTRTIEATGPASPTKRPSGTVAEPPPEPDAES